MLLRVQSQFKAGYFPEDASNMFGLPLALVGLQERFVGRALFDGGCITPTSFASSRSRLRGRFDLFSVVDENDDCDDSDDDVPIVR